MYIDSAVSETTRLQVEIVTRGTLVVQIIKGCQKKLIFLYPLKFPKYNE